ncbi:MAG TPA: FAD-dependent oxidoreductase [Gemmatimonadales bacterium]|jgi:protoporphyrinogen oxidase|nr:FAD-dependent oxidoreductase [Gemmatimonadales bacterium]
MAQPSVVVLGGGLSGVATAYTLARAGLRDVTLVESGGSLGGLAGSFEREQHFYPLGYHHILHRDRALLFFLDLVGALPDVRWRRVRMLFNLGTQSYDLGSPAGFLRFPMSLPDKARFVRLMLKAFGKRDWSDWQDRSAAELVDECAGPGVREALFERLTRLKFELPCSEVSGAWLGARLHYREGSAPLGYIPGANWTKVLCDGVTRLLEQAGVRVRLGSPVTKLFTGDGLIREAELAGGERLGGDLFVSSIPTEVYLRLLPGDATPELASIRYSALISLVCATRQAVRSDAYWINLASLDRTACGIFLLSSLNPSIGRPGDSCVNFVTHLRGRDRPLFQEPDERLVERYRADFRAVFGFELEPFWTHLARVPMYSPVFGRSFRNPPLKSASWHNLYFAGNYRTFPTIVSTGTALGSGVETGQALLRDLGERTDLAGRISGYRLRSMPRA